MEEEEEEEEDGGEDRARGAEVDSWAPDQAERKVPGADRKNRGPELVRSRQVEVTSGPATARDSGSSEGEPDSDRGDSNPSDRESPSRRSADVGRRGAGESREDEDSSGSFHTEPDSEADPVWSDPGVDGPEVDSWTPEKEAKDSHWANSERPQSHTRYTRKVEVEQPGPEEDEMDFSYSHDWVYRLDRVHLVISGSTWLLDIPGQPSEKKLKIRRPPPIRHNSSVAVAMSTEGIPVALPVEEEIPPELADILSPTPVVKPDEVKPEDDPEGAEHWWIRRPMRWDPDDEDNIPWPPDPDPDPPSDSQGED
jgi:hypothetical protein